MRIRKGLIPTVPPEQRALRSEVTKPQGRRRCYTHKEIAQALARADGNRFAAAKALGCHPTTITNCIQRWPDLLKIEQASMDEKDAHLGAVAVGCLRALVAAAQANLIRPDGTLNPKPGVVPRDQMAAINYFASRTRQMATRYAQHTTVGGVDGKPLVQITLTMDQAKAMSDDDLMRIVDGDTRVLATVK